MTKFLKEQQQKQETGQEKEKKFQETRERLSKNKAEDLKHLATVPEDSYSAYDYLKRYIYSECEKAHDDGAFAYPDYAKDGEISKLEKTFKVSLPEDLKDFYKKLGHFFGGDISNSFTRFTNYNGITTALSLGSGTMKNVSS